MMANLFLLIIVAAVKPNEIQGLDKLSLKIRILVAVAACICRLYIPSAHNMTKLVPYMNNIMVINLSTMVSTKSIPYTALDSQS
jgi:hypothetical protein